MWNYFVAHIHTPMKTTTLNQLLLASCLATLSVACGGDQQDQDPKTKTTASTEQSDASAEVSMKSRGQITILTPRTDVTKSELYCGEQEFDSLVHWGNPATHVPMTGSIPRFTVGSFQALLPNQSCSGNEELGFLVRYGADNGALKFAYRFVCMTLQNVQGTDEGNFTEIDPGNDAMYEVDGSEDLQPGQSVKAWNDGYGLGLQNNVVVDKYDHNRFQKIYQTDAGFAVHRVSAINALIADNSLQEEDYIQVVPIAEPLSWPQAHRGADFSIHTCMVAFDKQLNERVIDSDPVPTRPLEGRGSDLGSACPPMCYDHLAFPTTGINMRSACMAGQP